MLNPEYGVGDIAKELGKKWSDADPETKSKYEAMAEKDKARYERVTYPFVETHPCNRSTSRVVCISIYDTLNNFTLCLVVHSYLSRIQSVKLKTL